MKKITTLVLMVFLSANCYAASFEIKPEISHFSYRENNIPVGRESITVKEDGVFYGLHGTIENREKIYLALDGRYAIGFVDYSGTGEIDGIEDRTYEVRGLIGYPFKNLVVFTGYGQRYLIDKGNGLSATTGELAYDRESTYHYIPLGVKFDKFKFPVQAEIDVLLSGNQKSHLDKLNLGLPLINNDQKSGVGFKVSLDAKKSFKKVDVVLTPFIRGWKIQSSEVDNGFYEPKNSSIEVGGSVGIKF